MEITITLTPEQVKHFVEGPPCTYKWDGNGDAHCEDCERAALGARHAVLTVLGLTDSDSQDEPDGYDMGIDDKRKTDDDIEFSEQSEARRQRISHIAKSSVMRKILQRVGKEPPNETS